MNENFQRDLFELSTIILCDTCCNHVNELYDEDGFTFNSFFTLYRVKNRGKEMHYVSTVLTYWRIVYLQYSPSMEANSPRCVLEYPCVNIYAIRY